MGGLCIALHPCSLMRVLPSCACGAAVEGLAGVAAGSAPGTGTRGWAWNRGSALSLGSDCWLAPAIETGGKGRGGGLSGSWAWLRSFPGRHNARCSAASPPVVPRGVLRRAGLSGAVY